MPLLALAALVAIAFSASAVPSVAIASPSEGASINSGTVPLTLDIQGFTLNGSAVGMANVADEGHYHLLLDGAYQKFDFTTSTFMADVPAGTHELTVALANNDHSLYNINATVNVTILAGAPRVRILSPASSTAWDSSSVELRIATENFTYNAGAVGQANVAGEGHYHVNVNGGYFYFGTTEFFNVTYLSPGQSYALRVELHQNDHSIVSPLVYDEVYVTIAAGAPELNLDFALFQANVNASSVNVGFQVRGFTIDAAAVGQAAATDRGHYHAWLDGVFLGPAALNPLPLSDLSVGAHMIVVELRNNDHTELSPRVVDFTIFTVLANAPRLTIVAPSDPATVNASSLKLTVTVGNFTLDGAKVGQGNVAGEGHFHILVDGVYVGFGAGGTAMVSDLLPGPHVIKLQLQNNDHTDLTWPSFDTVRITVSANAPRVTITSPAATSTVNTSSLALAFTVGNFTLDGGAVGAANVAGTGHWHLLVDGVYSGFGAGLTATAVHLMPGTHMIAIQLQNNDHTDLTWPSWDSVEVTVPVGAVGLAITAPATGASVALNYTAVVVMVSNFTLMPLGTPNNVVGQGHLHIMVDGSLATMSAALSTVIGGLSAGSHTIRVELAQNDHSALSPAVVDEITVSVVGAGPTITLTGPTAGATIVGNTTTVSATVTNFVLSAAHVGAANVYGEGHWHVLVDGVYVGFSATGSVEIMDLTPGSHLIRVELHNNDHSALGIDVSSQVTVTVQAAQAPSVRISTPANNAEVTGTTLNLTFIVANFTLVAVGSTANNAANAGHLHVLVDGVVVQMISVDTVSLTNLTAGNHTIRVELANNDHTAIAGASNASSITVKMVAATTTPPPSGGFLPGFESAFAVAAIASIAVLSLVRRRRAL